MKITATYVEPSFTISGLTFNELRLLYNAIGRVPGAESRACDIDHDRTIEIYREIGRAVDAEKERRSERTQD